MKKRETGTAIKRRADFSLFLFFHLFFRVWKIAHLFHTLQNSVVDFFVGKSASTQFRSHVFRLSLFILASKPGFLMQKYGIV